MRTGAGALGKRCAAAPARTGCASSALAANNSTMAWAQRCNALVEPAWELRVAALHVLAAASPACRSGWQQPMRLKAPRRIKIAERWGGAPATSTSASWSPAVLRHRRLCQ